MSTSTITAQEISAVVARVKINRLVSQALTSVEDKVVDKKYNLKEEDMPPPLMNSDTEGEESAHEEGCDSMSLYNHASPGEEQDEEVGYDSMPSLEASSNAEESDEEPGTVQTHQPGGQQGPIIIAIDFGSSHMSASVVRRNQRVGQFNAIIGGQAVTIDTGDSTTLAAALSVSANGNVSVVQSQDLN